MTTARLAPEVIAPLGLGVVNKYVGARAPWGRPT